MSRLGISLSQNETTHVGYFRRCGLDLSFTGAVVMALLVTAGIRVGFGRSCASGSMGVGFSDADGAALAGCCALLSRPRDSAFSRLLEVLVGREGCADALFGCGPSEDSL